MNDTRMAPYKFSWRGSLFLRFTLILCLIFLGFFLIFTILQSRIFRILKENINEREQSRVTRVVQASLRNGEEEITGFLQSLSWNKELPRRVRERDVAWLQSAFTRDLPRSLTLAGVMDDQGVLLYKERSLFGDEDLQELLSFCRANVKTRQPATFYWSHNTSVYLVGVGNLPTAEPEAAKWVCLAKPLDKQFVEGLRQLCDGEIELFVRPPADLRGLWLRDWRKRPVAWVSARPSSYFLSLFASISKIYYWHFVLVVLIFAGGIVLFSVRLRGRLVAEFNSIMKIFEKLYRGEYSVDVARSTAGDELGVFSSQVQEASQTISQLLSTDPLTKVYNRTYFYHRLREEIHRARRYGRPLALLILDLDNFKGVNDKLGHQAGDQLLRDVASAIEDILRKSDILSRWGGEEFAIILPETEGEAALEVAERLRGIVEVVSLGYTVKNVSCTASIGIAVLQRGESEESLIRRTDQMLYRAKERGKNQVAISPWAV